MFDMPAEARQVIEERFAPNAVEMVFGALRPVIIFSETDDGRTGGSRIGGTPDLPKGTDWPRRPVPENIDEIAKRSGEPYDKELRQHLAANLPYAFFAQIDLKEAADLGELAKDLPNEGRLLFFYDTIGGPYDNAAQSGRVIWDQSPVGEIASAPMPNDLAAAAAAYRKMIDETNKQYGLESPGREPGTPEPGTSYGGPSRPMALKAALQLPAYSSLEFQASGKLEKTYSADRAVIGGEQAFSQAYSELSGEYYPQNQLLGAPVPVQDDPRYNAFGGGEDDTQFPAGDDPTKKEDVIPKEAEEWRLLLQIEMTDWMQDSAEGTVYFLIRKDDLENRAFDRVVAVYQQT